MVFFLCKGITVYRGPATEIVPYFAKHGYQCEMYDNPADFALDTLIEASRTSGALDKLDEAYRASSMHTSLLLINEKQSFDDKLEQKRRQQTGKAARNMPVETYYVAKRTLTSSVRNPQLFLSQIMISIVMGLLVGVVFFDLKKTTEPGVQDRFGTLFFIIMNQVFSSLSSLETLIKERVLFIHVSFYFLFSTKKTYI